MPTRLLALNGGPDIVVNAAFVLVGRHPQCDARIDSMRVSRRHFCLSSNGERVEIRDLGSTNGIQINGQRVLSAQLRAGDEVSIANLQYIVK